MPDPNPAYQDARRNELNMLLEAILGTSEVHFQPPNNLLMEYPAIVYERDSAQINHAGNSPYRSQKRYQITLISYDPDTEYWDKLAALPRVAFERHFKADGLNHDVFTIYF